MRLCTFAVHSIVYRRWPLPNAPTHDAITVVVAVVGAGFATYQYDWRTGFIIGASTLASGLIFSPDLDLNSTPSNRWGFLEPIWWGYRWVLKHRSVWSHGPIISAPIRLIYFALMLWLVGTSALYFIRAIWLSESTSWLTEAGHVYQVGALLYEVTPKPYLLAALVGMIIGAESHIWADFIYSRIKRKRKR